LEFFSDSPIEIESVFFEVVANVGTQVGRVFERVQAEEAQQQLSMRLLRSQDAERREIARELHDSVGQYLSFLSMSLEGVKRLALDLSAPAGQKLQEAVETAEKCSSEIRTISYLLHPPLLEELGLASAAHWYIEGFASRSDIKVDVHISESLIRLDEAVELVLFRVLQGCLTNIPDHAGSITARVKIEADSRKARLEVSDQGKGLPKRTLALWSGRGSQSSVGLNGMRERVKDVGGVLEISSGKEGTVIKAIIPLACTASIG
jgi:two-component system, NarL family, sensor kinase